MRIGLMAKEGSLRRKHGIRTERSERGCRWRWPSCLLNALALICLDMQLYVCIQNSFDADRQRRVGAHDWAARFVYVFRGVSERERRGRKDTGLTATLVELRNGIDFLCRTRFFSGGMQKTVFMEAKNLNVLPAKKPFFCRMFSKNSFLCWLKLT